MERMREAVGSEGRDAPSFRADPEAVYAFVGRFFAALVASGVEHVVLSPGSRSTPLAIGADCTPGLRSWIELDERAAGFFALGIGKATRRPAVLVCTSGTAAANYLPAIVEAHHARVPLVVLTADRPSELRDFGAGQTIEQPGLYGRLPRWCVEVPIPEAGEAALRHAAVLAARAVERATARPAGAVHLNWPLREPLAPTPRVLAACSAARPASAAADGVPRFTRAQAGADARDVDELVAAVEGGARGVVCCGPMDPDPSLADALARFARAADWPLLADPASSLRAGAWADPALVLDGGDLLARAGAFAARMQPELVLRVGDTPVSKAQRLWLEAASPRAVWWLDEGGQWGEPSRQVTRIVQGGAAALLDAAAERLAGGTSARRASAWAEGFRSARARGRAALDAALREPAAFSGLGVAAAIARALPAGATLVASNSMPIRLLDLALSARSEPLRVLCNRGASGIDGVTSTALGVAAATRGPALLFTGDLAFLHDLSGLLLARREAIPLAIVVLDDGGGGIFSFLPIAEQGEAVAFERLFRTPHGIELERAAALFELDYSRADDLSALEAALAHALGRPRVSLVHVRVDPDENVARFRSAVARACAAIEAEAGSGAECGAEADAGPGAAGPDGGRAGARSVFVAAGGLRLHALVEAPSAAIAAAAGGIAVPDVLVLHGFTGSAGSMAGVAAGLAGVARVARLELVGHGESDAPATLAPYAMAACAEQIGAAARALFDRPPHLLGYSMGGRAAIAAAVTAPGAFASLVLVGATAGIADPALRAERIAADRALADSIERDGLARFVDAWMSQPLFASQARLGPEALVRARAERLAQRPHGLANSLRGMGAGAQTPLHDRLGEIAVPVLLVVGEEDAKFRAIAAELARALPRARIEVVPGAGHAAHLEAPEIFAARVRAFLAEVTRP